MKLLLISLPLHRISMPPFLPAYLQGGLADFGCDIDQYDTNLDFQLTSVYSKDQGHVINLKSNDFYVPETLLSALTKINQGLSGLDGQPGLFSEFCQKRFGPRLIESNPDLVVLCLTDQNQATYCNTLADFIRSNSPGTDIAVIKPDTVKIKLDKKTGSLFTIDQLDQFFNTITGSSENPTQEPVIPNFSGLPLNKYLVPEPVIPIGIENAGKNFYKNAHDIGSVIQMLSEKNPAKKFIVQDGTIDPGNLTEIFSHLPRDICLSLFIPMVSNVFESEDFDFKSAYDKGLRVVQWPVREKDPDAKSLWAASKAGIWNHLTVSADIQPDIGKKTGSFISINPNIAHSFEYRSEISKEDHGLKYEIDPSLKPYSKLKEIPGRPFWQKLDDPAYRLLFVERYGVKAHFGQRFSKEKVFSLGSGISYYFTKPSDLPDGFLDEIIKMVDAGGSVATKWVRYNLERAYLIAYAVENGVIVGNSSLKHPRRQFIDRVKSITGLDFTGHLERGYTSVRPEYRALGIGKKLLEGLTSRAKEHKIFSVIGEDNLATQKIALRNKTRKVATYFSEIMKKEVGLWMPEWMTDNEDDKG